MRLLALYFLVFVLFASNRFWLLLLWVVASPVLGNLIRIRNDNPFFGSYRIVDYIGYLSGPDKQLVELLDLNRIILGLLFIASVRNQVTPSDPSAAGLQRWLGILTLIVLASALLSNNVLNAERIAIDTFGLCYASFLIGKANLASAQAWRKFANAFLGLGLLLGCICVAEYRMFGEWNMDRYGDLHRVCGPFRYWETLGMLVAMAAFIVCFRLFVIVEQGAMLKRGAYLLLGLLLAWSVYRTQTRTIMLSLAAGASVVAYVASGDFMSRKLVRWLSIGGLLAGVFLYVAPELLQNTGFYQRTLSRQSTEAERMETYVAATRMFLSNPLSGIGLKNFQVKMRDYMSVNEVEHSSLERSSCHSSYFVIAAECGILGLVPLGIVILFSLRTCKSYYRMSVTRTDRAWAVAMLGMTVTYFLCGATFDPFFDPTMQNHLFYMSLGCTVGRLEGLCQPVAI